MDILLDKEQSRASLATGATLCATHATYGATCQTPRAVYPRAPEQQRDAGAGVQLHHILGRPPLVLMHLHARCTFSRFPCRTQGSSNVRVRSSACRVRTDACMKQPLYLQKDPRRQQLDEH